MFLGIYHAAWANIGAVLITLFAIWSATSSCDARKPHEPLQRRMVVMGCLNIFAMVLNLSLFTYGMVLRAELQQERAQEMADYKKDIFLEDKVTIYPAGTDVEALFWRTYK
ncbi:hypothetical protein D9M71_481050 [compost metagenome]